MANPLLPKTLSFGMAALMTLLMLTSIDHLAQRDEGVAAAVQAASAAGQSAQTAAPARRG
ncbi:MAG: hypothetical protein Q8N44_16025 [Rubrivivax sp.]|nr:hypothetical protein [Rubrivivax sp.]